MSFTGMNGTLILNAADMPVGKVPGESYGYTRDLTVTVDIRVERLERRDEYETTTHEKVRGPLDFSLTTSVWMPGGRDIVAGGATSEPLREVIAHGRFLNGLDAESVGALAEMHDKWHMNGMQAACAHQTVVWEEAPYRRPSLDLTTVCPETGYRYGSAWLVEPLPADFMENVRSLVGRMGDVTVYDNGEG